MNTVLPSFENIKELNEYLTPFPKVDSIFVEHQSWLKEHFLPLISIDLGMLKDEWRGQVVHMISQCEDICGFIGDNTAPYHSTLCSENYLAFKLSDDNRYEFLADEGFFIRSPKNSELKAKLITDNRLDIDEHFLEKQQKYQECQAHFKKHGILQSDLALIDRLGGGFYYGNWVESVEIPVDFAMNLPADGLGYDELDLLPNNGIEITYEGNPFYFIAGVGDHHYGGDGAYIMLMYEPVSRVVLFTYDYS